MIDMTKSMISKSTKLLSRGEMENSGARCQEETFLKEMTCAVRSHVGSKVARDSQVENQQVVFTCFAEPNAKTSSHR